MSDESIERDITVGFIVSRDFVQRIRTGWDSSLLDSEAAKYLVNWCVEFFDNFGHPPGINIRALYEDKLIEGKISSELGEEIEEEILPGLDEEYIKDPKINVDYLEKRTRKFLRKKRLRLVDKQIREKLSAGDIDGAESIVLNYNPVSSEREDELDFHGKDFEQKVYNAFTYSRENILYYPGALGEMLNRHLIPTGFIAFMGINKVGKCLPGNQRVLTTSGNWEKIEDVISKNIKKIISYDEKNNCFVESKVSQFWDNGVKPVFEITTKTGRKVQVTGNHPFLTPDGWEELDFLKAGDFIAVPKTLPSPKNTKEIPDEEIKLIGYLLAEGNCYEKLNDDRLENVRRIGFTNTNEKIKKDFTFCVESLGCSVSWTGINARVQNSLKNKGRHNKNYVFDIVKKYGLLNKLSYTKAIPEKFFNLSQEKTALLLRVIFSCDGWVSERDPYKGSSTLGISLANENLIRQISFLLTRFGVVHKIRYKRNDKFGAWDITVGSYEFMERFKNSVGFLFEKQEKLNRVLSKKKKTYHSFLDVFPYSLAKRFYKEAAKEINFKFYENFKRGYQVRHWLKKRKPMLKETFMPLRNTKTGKKYFQETILWDEIIKIEYLGKKRTYDLTVKKYHNFIAENVLVHNTQWLLDMALRGFRQGNPVAFFQAGDLTRNDFIIRSSVYLSHLPFYEEDVGESWQPRKDCIWNQIDRCEKKERESDHGVFNSMKDDLSDFYRWRNKKNLLEAKEKFPDYHPCTGCVEYFKNPWGTPWMEKKELDRSLTYHEALKVYDNYLSENKHGFRVATYSNGSLSVPLMESRLDLWSNEGFNPKIIVVDYADYLVSHAFSEYRHQQNDVWAKLRGLSQDRDALVITVTQADAQAFSSSILRLKNFSEDRRKFDHPTGFFGINRDPAGIEKQMGLARFNELALREGYFDSFRQVSVLQNLTIGRSFIGSYWSNM